MESKLLKTVEEIIANTCKGVNLSNSQPIYMPIKNNNISVSKSRKSLYGADECILLLPYLWENTVPNRYGPGNVSFINTLRKIVSIDKEGKVHDYYYGDGAALHIGCDCYAFGANVILYLKYSNSILYRCNPTVDNIHELWKFYQISEKLLHITRDKLLKE